MRLNTVKRHEISKRFSGHCEILRSRVDSSCGDMAGMLSDPLLQVRYLKIIEKSGYQALPWVRYITQNGDYQLRTQ